MTPQGVAEPTCRCKRRIWRLALDSARWRHDNWGITCPPPDPTFVDHAKGNQP